MLHQAGELLDFKEIDKLGIVDKEKKPRNIPQVINKFRSSSSYNAGLAEFMSGKTVTEEYPGEFMDKFEEMDLARRKLIDFIRGTEILIQKPNTSPKRENPIREYLNILREYKEHPQRYDNVHTYESVRGGAHDRATRFIANKYKLSNSLSVGVVQIIAIQNGLESYDHVDDNRQIHRIRTLL